MPGEGVRLGIWGLSAPLPQVQCAPSATPYSDAPASLGVASMTAAGGVKRCYCLGGWVVGAEGMWGALRWGWAFSLVSSLSPIPSPWVCKP